MNQQIARSQSGGVGRVLSVISSSVGINLVVVLLSIIIILTGLKSSGWL